MHIVQMCVQGRWVSDPSLLILPHLDHTHIELLNKKLTKGAGVTELTSLPELMTVMERQRGFLLSSLVDTRALTREQVTKVWTYY